MRELRNSKGWRFTFYGGVVLAVGGFAPNLALMLAIALLLCRERF